jgi:hypothetical protein
MVNRKQIELIKKLSGYGEIRAVFPRLQILGEWASYVPIPSTANPNPSPTGPTARPNFQRPGFQFGSKQYEFLGYICCEDGNWPVNGWGIRVNMYDPEGNFLRTFVEITDPFGLGLSSDHSARLKISPVKDINGNRTIWFGINDIAAYPDQSWWFKIVVDSNFETVISGWPLGYIGFRFCIFRGYLQFEGPDVAIDPLTGDAYFLGTTDPNLTGIGIYDSNGTELYYIGDGLFGGGIAFDPNGNLYVGTIGPYIYGEHVPTEQNYVHMFTAANVAGELGSPDNTIALPTPGSYYLGVHSIAADINGNIYVSANGGISDLPITDEHGYIFKIDPWDENDPPAAMTLIYTGDVSPMSTNLQRCLVHNSSDNTLHILQNWAWFSGDPAKIVVINASTGAIVTDVLLDVSVNSSYLAGMDGAFK